MDELATTLGVDPLAFRIRHLKDERAVDLLRAVALRAGWDRGKSVAPLPGSSWRRGAESAMRAMCTANFRVSERHGQRGSST